MAWVFFFKQKTAYEIPKRDWSSDVCSSDLVVMYEMFTGRVPFEADTYMGVLTKHLYVEPTPPSVLLGATANLGALEQVTLRCLEKKAENRYGSMQDLLAELRRVASFADDGSLSVQPMELREPRPPH